jgi:hypothetical protein
MEQKKRDTLLARNTQQQIRLSILNAVNNLESSVKSLGGSRGPRRMRRQVPGCREPEIHARYRPDAVRVAGAEYANAGAIVSRSGWGGAAAELLALYTQTGELLEQRGIVVQ